MNMKIKSKEGLRRFIILLCLVFGLGIYAEAQTQVTINGTVLDETNQPISGLIVKVKDSTHGAPTDFSGKYTITVNAGDILVFTYLGYKTREEVANTSKTINVRMEEDTKLLQEVVVVGYNVVRRESLTGSLDVLSEGKLKETTSPNVENMLSSRTPGVLVNLGSGRPGEPGIVRVRGTASLTGNTEPLWVVDGVIMGINPDHVTATLNPNDIESLTVLKDAASTAIYGSRGAAGVILVTTKKGKLGRMAVNFSGKFVATFLDKGNLKPMSGSQLYDYYNSFEDKSELEKQTWWKPELRNRNFDWWNLAKQTGFAQDYIVSLSGGNEQLRTYASIGVYDEEGAVKGYDYTKFTSSLKMDYNPTKWLTLKPNFNASYRKTHNEEWSIGAGYSGLPWDSPYLEDGSLVPNRPGNAIWVHGVGDNYLNDLGLGYVQSKTYEALTGFDFDVRITDWLTFASVNSFKYYQWMRTDYKSPLHTSGRSVGGYINDEEHIANKLYSNQLVRINKLFDKHFLGVVVGYEWDETKNRTKEQRSTNFVPGLSGPSIGSTPDKATGGRTNDAVQSYLSNFNYSYDDKYMAQVSVRRDGASNFGKDVRYGNFFSFSGGWNIHKEAFINHKDLTNLKIRASHGVTGNRPPNLYSHLTLYGLGTGGSYNAIPGAVISQMGNPNLRWEKTTTTGIGLDVSYLNRFHLTFDVYNSEVKDLLYSRRLPSVNGVTSVLDNAGSMRNRGLELTLKAEIIDTKDWSWDVDFNLGLTRNKILTLSGGREQEIEGATRIAGGGSIIKKPGYTANSWYLHEWAGVDPANGNPLWYTTNDAGEKVTTTAYATANRVIAGSYLPKYLGGFSTSLRFKDIDFGATFGYSVGGKIYNYSRVEYDSDGAYTNRNQMSLHSGWRRWEKPGDIATHPKPTWNNRTQSNQPSTRFLETGTYLKLRYLTVGYNLPFQIKGISNIRAYLSGENLFTISHFSGVDPEIEPYDRRISGVYTAAYPKTKKFAFGINFTL